MEMYALVFWILRGSVEPTFFPALFKEVEFCEEALEELKAKDPSHIRGACIRVNK